MKDVYYFSHDSNARNDEKILMLRAECGWEGYGIYWALIEMMFENADTCLSKRNIKGIAVSYNIDIKLLESVISICLREGLFSDSEDVFWSESLRRRKKKYHEIKKQKSEAGKKGMAKRWGFDNGVITDNNECYNGVITKNNKVNEIKVKNYIYSDSFTEKLKNYPGKKIKSVRDNKLPKLINEYGEEQILRCIERYANEVKGKDKKYILNESTFWNGRYKDYLDENFQVEDVKKQQEYIPTFVYRNL